MSALLAVLSVVTLAGPAPVTLTVRYSDGTAAQQVAHLRCRGTWAHADGFLTGVRITGTIGARWIDRRFKRTNGCEIGDWSRAVPLVPRVRAGRAP